MEKVGWVSEMIINGSGAMRKRINRNKGSSSEWRFSCSKTEDGVTKKKKKRVKGENRVYAARDPTLLDPNIIPPVHQISTTIERTV